MTKSELNTLQELMKNEDIKGKKLLDQFIWLNTTKPKYSIGDYYIITDLGHRVYGVPVENKKAKLVGIKTNILEKLYMYTFELEFETTDGRHLNVTSYVTERHIGDKTSDNHNVITACDNRYANSMSLTLMGTKAW